MVGVTGPGVMPAQATVRRTPRRPLASQRRTARSAPAGPYPPPHHDKAHQRPTVRQMPPYPGESRQFPVPLVDLIETGDQDGLLPVALPTMIKGLAVSD